MLTRRLPISNKLLAAVKEPDYQRLLLHMELVTLTFGQVLHEPGDSIKHVYFPNDSLVSLLTMVDHQLALAVSLVAREGMVGQSFALGLSASPVRALVQGGGTAMRMKAPCFAGNSSKISPCNGKFFSIPMD